MYLGRAHTVYVASNHFYDYRVGIQWWGGDAAAERNGQHHQLPRLAQDWTVEYNEVKNVQEGIWGSMGQNILVRNNYVESCVDVCLDDEGSNWIRFQNNEARYAGQYVLAVFDFARGVEFTGNSVYQDGRIWPPFNGQGDHPGVNLFGTSNAAQALADIGITVDGNHFYYTGAGVGRVIKAPSRRIDFTNNTLSNTVIDMAGNNNGAVQIAYNTLSFGNAIGEPGITAGGNHAEWGGFASTIDGTYNLVVSNNQVESTVAQTGLAGVHARQWSPNVVQSWLHHNTVRNFDAAVTTQGSGGAHVFRVESNTLYQPMPPCGFQHIC